MVEDISHEEVERLIEERAACRRSRDFEKADTIKMRLENSGIMLSDIPYKQGNKMLTLRITRLISACEQEEDRRGTERRHPLPMCHYMRSLLKPSPSATEPTIVFKILLSLPRNTSQLYSNGEIRRKSSITTMT